MLGNDWRDCLLFEEDCECSRKIKKIVEIRILTESLPHSLVQHVTWGKCFSDRRWHKVVLIWKNVAPVWQKVTNTLSFRFAMNILYNFAKFSYFNSIFFDVFIL
jgi:hypothetical protein